MRRCRPPFHHRCQTIGQIMPATLARTLSNNLDEIDAGGLLPSARPPFIYRMQRRPGGLLGLLSDVTLRNEFRSAVLFDHGVRSADCLDTQGRDTRRRLRFVAISAYRGSMSQR